jgi:hypothetical protein
MKALIPQNVKQNRMLSFPGSVYRCISALRSSGAKTVENIYNYHDVMTTFQPSCNMFSSSLMFLINAHFINTNCTLFLCNSTDYVINFISNVFHFQLPGFLTIQLFKNSV